jgi:hypothetical protein
MVATARSTAESPQAVEAEIPALKVEVEENQ